MIRRNPRTGKAVCMLRKIIPLMTILVILGVPVVFASPIDLTNSTNPDIYTGITASDGTIWRVIKDQPTGTGVYKPFLRLQMKGIESGLNTDFGGPSDVGSNKPPLDDVSGIWTHSLTFGDVWTVTRGGKRYYSLTLDINESANSKDKFLSLDDLKIYSYNGSLGGYVNNTSILGTPKYDLTNSHPNGSPVLLDYSLASSGSGKDDMEVLIPISFFSNVLPSDYFYLYSKFGGVGWDKVNGRDYSSSAGFEEWHYDPPAGVPEPSSILLLGTGLIALIGVRRKLKS
jgi:hypothetical protein